MDTSAYCQMGCRRSDRRGIWHLLTTSVGVRILDLSY